MGSLLARWALLSFAILATPYIVSGVHVESIGAAIAAAAVLGVLNAFLKPILVLLTLPITVLTLGIFLVLLNGVVFQFAASLVSGLSIDSFWSAMWASLWVSLVGWMSNLSVRRQNGVRRIVVHSSPMGRQTRDLN